MSQIGDGEQHLFQLKWETATNAMDSLAGI
jgi:hypothetical protein